jgi:hydroxyacylglutathione hydrolase
MIIRTFFDEKLAQASYLVGCAATGQAIVIDPLRDIKPYLDMASSQGLQITAVTETHIHADFLSGSREVAAATGGQIYLSDEGDDEWKYAYGGESGVILLRDRDVITIGNLTLRAIHTPGHTPEHLSFLLTDHPVSDIPHSLFTGDFLFVGDVGRPDLLERAANFAGTMEKSARTLFRSLALLDTLPDSLLLWPGHGAGSACGKSLGGSPVTSLGYERATNWALRAMSEEEFVTEVLSGQPEPPLYFKEMKRLNKLGPNVLGHLPSPAKVSKPVGQLVDLRNPVATRKGLYSGAVVIPSGKGFTNWAGWLLPYGKPVTLLADHQSDANQAARDMATIGLDDISGWVEPSDLAVDGFNPVSTVTAETLDHESFILDVRGRNERAKSQIEGSWHIPLGELRERLDEVPRDRTVTLHCASGTRSLIAYSILRNAGFTQLVDLAGGIAAYQSNSRASK